MEEYNLDVDADDLEPMLKLFAAAGHVVFDTERKVLMFSNLSAK